MKISDLGSAKSLKHAISICNEACGIEAGDVGSEESEDYFGWSRIRDWLMELEQSQKVISKIEKTIACKKSL